MSRFLPITMEEVNRRYGGEVDFVFVTGDAYVDHPSFGAAIISRILEHDGYRVAILAQPDYTSKTDFMRFGKPKLGFLVNSGNLDSMVNHYTVNKKKRNMDAFSPGGKPGRRPDRAVIVYTNRIREAYGKILVIIGGLEASLRRLAHYDYWSDKVRQSILVDSQADFLIFGMGDITIRKVARYLQEGNPEGIRMLPGIVYQTKSIGGVENALILNSFEEVRDQKKLYAKFTKESFEEQNPYIGKTLIQHHIDRYVVQNPPCRPLQQKELDEVYRLPFTRAYHPVYEKEGGVPAIHEVKFSIISQRGCFGGCNFCSLSFHQGRIVTSRSEQSILEEAKKITDDPDFKGYIHDVGGPTANFRFPACSQQLKVGACKKKQCLFPQPCRNLKVDHREYFGILRALRNLPKVKKVFVRSGIRFDYLMADPDDSFFQELVKYHISGQLKVAPEHFSNRVLHYMGKPNIEVFESFMEKFYRLTKKAGKEQYLVPYLMSSHPGSDISDAIALALFLRKHKMTPEQVQDFYPTPGTISTAMYYTEMDPFTGKHIYVAKSYREKNMQRALLQTYKPENREMVKKALAQAGMQHLERILLPYHKSEKETKNDDFRRKSSIKKNQGRAQGTSSGSQSTGHHRGPRGNHRGR